MPEENTGIPAGNTNEKKNTVSPDPIPESSLSKSKSKFYWGLAVGLGVALAGIAAVWIFSHRAEISHSLELRALAGDEIGIEAETAFVFSSEKDYSTEEVKKIVQFDPPVDFSVEKMDDEMTGSGKNGSVKKRYKLQPAEELSVGALYQAAVTNGEYADREYGWAFQVKSPFQVIATTPRHKGINVPLNSGVEVIFNRQKLVDPQDYFSIEPRVEGSFETRGDTLIFKSSGFQPGTLYRVTIKKGLKDKTLDEMLEQDYSFQFETGKENSDSSSNYQGDYFYLNDNWVDTVPGKSPMIRAAVGENFKSDSLELSLYRFESASEFIAAYSQSRNWELSWSNYHKDTRYVPSPEKKMLSFRPEIRQEGYNSFFEIPQQLEAGYYILSGKLNERLLETWIQVNPSAHYYAVTEESGLFWLYSFDDRRPISEASLAYYSPSGEKSDLGKTNAEGLSEFGTPQGLRYQTEYSYSPSFFLAEIPGTPAKVVKVEGRTDPGKNHWSFLSVDRPVYQLKDKVQFWGVIKGLKEDLRKKKVTINIKDQQFFWYSESGSTNNGLMASRQVSVSPFDTVKGEVSFQGFIPGSYVMEVVYGDEVLATANFQVEAYTKPAYQILITPEKEQLYAGEEVRFKVRAEFFDGTPVSNLELKSAVYGAEEAPSSLKVDENGEATFTVKSSYSEDGYYPNSLVVQLSPQLSEEGEITGSSQVQVFGPDMYLRTYQKMGAEGKSLITAKLNAITLRETKEEKEDGEYYYYQDFIGDPVKNHPLTAELVKTTYIKVESGEIYDYIQKVTRKIYRYETNVETVEKLEGRTNDDGEWIIERDFPLEKDSSYKLVFNGRSSNDRKIEGTAYIYSYRSHLQPNESDTLSISLSSNLGEDDPGYQIGNEMQIKLSVASGELPADSKILYYRYQNNLQKNSVTTDRELKEEFGEALIPGISYQAVVFGPDGFVSSNPLRLGYDNAEKRLKIGIETDKKAYRPKEKITVNFSVQDAIGIGQAAEINASVVDEAVFKVADFWDKTEIIDELYSFPEVVPITGATDFSRYNLSGEMGCFLAGTQVTLSGNRKKSIEDVRIGDRILTLADADKGELVPAVVQGISQHRVDEYLVINGTLKVTPEHRLWVNGEWRAARTIVIGDRLLTAAKEEVPVREVKRVLGRSIPVFNLIIGNYHTYLADDYYVHNEEKGGEERSNFVDTASFQSVAADNDGKAKMEFAAPDNITSWRLTARAFAPDKILAGEMTRLIKTTLPFFVEGTLSSIYLEGDEPTLKVRLYGDEYQSGEKAAIKVECDSLGLKKDSEISGNTAYIPIGKMKEGEHSITISAVQGNKKDSIVKKIHVVNGYARRVVSKFFNLSADAERIEGSSKGATNLLFVDQGKGRYFPALNEATWDFGTRLDQLLGRYLAQKMLHAEFDYSDDPMDPELGNYYTQEKALGLFPFYGAGDPELTAKVADAGIGFVSGETALYFRNILADQKSDNRQAVLGLYGLASLKLPVLDKINSAYQARSRFGLEEKVYLALALAKIGDKERARDFYTADIRPALKFSSLEGWAEKGTDQSSNLKFSATVAYLQSRLDLQSDFDLFWRYLENNHPEKDVYSLEKMMAVAENIRKVRSRSAEADFSSPIRSEKIKLEAGESRNITVSPDEISGVKISNIKGQMGMVVSYESEVDQAKVISDPRIKLERRFENLSGGGTDFKEGDLVRVILTPQISELAPDGEYQIIDFLPGALRPTMRTYVPGMENDGSNQCQPLWYPNRVENNISYFSINKNFTRERAKCQWSLFYYARAVSRGKFSADGALIQSVSSPLTLNFSQVQTVEIK